MRDLHWVLATSFSARLHATIYRCRVVYIFVCVCVYVCDVYIHTYITYTQRCAHILRVTNVPLPYVALLFTGSAWNRCPYNANYFCRKTSPWRRGLFISWAANYPPNDKWMSLCRRVFFFFSSCFHLRFFFFSILFAPFSFGRPSIYDPPRWIK